ncbi:DUF3991 and toprim domain-containing protein [Roseibium aggregatum]|jgi:hypothetical protein|uniref:DUF3991 and toprim domain-containing protein n=1 Tax=Roseibium aggregatum TaxID=187304 RepID=UPI001E5B275C|nr:DUF3991 and toprim domain-containing protein [Roseibium aggregatum]UES47973.1 DUF3991 domain-containing protein [Roseibium aggregatum]|eukprot:g20732.t1
MEKAALEELKEKVACAAVLETAGFAVDRRESTRRAVKYRRGGDIIIVIHDGKGWFDPLSDAKGDVFRLIEHLDGLPFATALHVVADLIGFRPAEPAWARQTKNRAPDQTTVQRWQNRRKPWRGSATWRYLRDARGIPEPVLRQAVAAGVLREGPHGSMWAGHTDEAGHVTGWEERGPRWRGFASGGAKVLFRFGPADATRLCVTEAAIDAMSLAAIERSPPGSLYLSTGGGWSPSTEAALRGLATRPDVLLVAATDANSQGEAFAERLRILAEKEGCNWQRLRPPSDDWNACLKEKE